jgi:hypothetical protein
MRSSVDSLPDWSVFQERETVPVANELLSPASELATTLRTTHALLSKMQQAIEDSEQSRFSELAQHAVLVGQLGMLLEKNADTLLASVEHKLTNPLFRFYKSLQIIQKQMLDALKKAGLEIEIPLNKSYAEVADSVEIEHWRHFQDISEEIVIEVIEPIIRKGSSRRAGRVVMGAPLHAQSPIQQDETIVPEQATHQEGQAE